MVYDMIFYKIRDQETEKEPKPPTQAYFDNF